MKRNRSLYFFTAVVVAALALGSRRYGVMLPRFITLYAGDTLWALMFFLLIGFVAVRWSSRRVAVITLLLACAGEISQLYHAPWIDDIRNTWLGGIILGYGFLWSDLVCDTVGVFLGWGGETASRKLKPRF
jgi:hypothetical protein